MVLRKRTVSQMLPLVLIIAGLLGLTASFALTYDKLQVLQNPNYRPSCTINPILSCGSVMKTEQASFAGVPNTIFGLMAFSALLTFGVIVASGVVIKRWIWLGAQVAATFGVFAMHYLFFQGVYRIHAICPWCFLVWMITIPVFWYITIYNLQFGHIRLHHKLKPVQEWLTRYHLDVLGIWYLVLFMMLLVQFWYYWSTLLP